MPKPQRTVTLIVAGLMLTALGATIATWSWGNVGERLRARGALAARNNLGVDTRALDVAQQLAPLAETRSEKTYAADALRLADYSVDFAFAAAIREAATAPPPSDSTIRAVAVRIKAAGEAVAADSDRVATLSAQLARVSAAGRQQLQQQLDVARAQLELDRDDADDAHLDLVRAGGDKLASIQQLRSQHDTSLHAPGAPAGPASAATAPPEPSIELTKSASILDQAGAWRSLDAKHTLLAQAHQDALDRIASLARAHDTLEKEVAAEKSQQQILHERGKNAGRVALAQSGATPKAKPAVSDTPSAGAAAPTAPATALSFLQDLASDQKDLAALDRRIANEEDLVAVYGSWGTLIDLRKQRFVHGLLLSGFWLLLLALLVVGANEGVQRIFSEDVLQHRRLHTLRTVTLFTIQGAGLIGILLLLFGMPSNFAAVVALAGAGLALALQDFILGFFGWFILMGKDGIRPGDWVEINGVGGEVLEVGLLQTVLLETSSWSGSGNPTGRKVTFVNSFAVQGHYFNFSTSGQWLWDELELQLPDNSDPYAVAEEIQKLAASETAPKTEAAEEEWRRMVPARARQAFTAEPSVTVRPSGGGVSVVVRYLTRASERAEVRAKLYRAMIALVHAKPES